MGRRTIWLSAVRRPGMKRFRNDPSCRTHVHPNPPPPPPDGRNRRFRCARPSEYGGASPWSGVWDLLSNGEEMVPKFFLRDPTQTATDSLARTSRVSPTRLWHYRPLMNPHHELPLPPDRHPPPPTTIRLQPSPSHLPPAWFPSKQVQHYVMGCPQVVRKAAWAGLRPAQKTLPAGRRVPTGGVHRSASDRLAFWAVPLVQVPAGLVEGPL